MSWDDNQETDTIYGDIKKETEKAYLVDVLIGEDVWIPKSQIENLQEVKQHYHSGKTTGLEFELPEWLISEKGIQ